MDEILNLSVFAKISGNCLAELQTDRRITHKHPCTGAPLLLILTML